MGTFSVWLWNSVIFRTEGKVYRWGRKESLLNTVLNHILAILCVHNPNTIHQAPLIGHKQPTWPDGIIGRLIDIHNHCLHCMHDLLKSAMQSAPDRFFALYPKCSNRFQGPRREKDLLLPMVLQHSKSLRKSDEFSSQTIVRNFEKRFGIAVYNEWPQFWRE